jgi:hypothetical protein
MMTGERDVGISLFSIMLTSVPFPFFSKPIEYAPIDDSFNPVIHRVNQAIRNRAVYSDREIDPIAPILVRYAVPPEDLIEKCQNQVDTLVELSEVKKGITPRISISICLKDVLNLSL